MTEPEFPDGLAGSTADWLAVLPGYQADLITSMLVAGEPEEVAIAWLSSTGPNDTAPFGGIRSGATLFYDNLLQQLQMVLCSDEETYRTERAQLFQQAKAGRAALVTGLATLVASAIGASPVLIAPAIALTLAVICRAGSKTVCELLADLIAARTAGQSSSAATLETPPTP